MALASLKSPVASTSGLTGNWQNQVGRQRRESAATNYPIKKFSTCLERKADLERDTFVMKKQTEEKRADTVNVLEPNVLDNPRE